MKRRDFLKTGALTAAASATGVAHAANSETQPEPSSLPDRPNILFIFTDQQKRQDLSYHGNPYVQTPNIDSLAAHGTSFQKSYCAAPICGPSRSSLVTSRMPHETLVNFNGEAPTDQILNMGHFLSKAGYHTVWGGKWHLPESYPLSKGEKSIPGFDELLDFYQEDGGRWYLGDVTDAPLADAGIRFLKRKHDKPWLLTLSFHNPHDICYIPLKPEKYPAPYNLDATPPLPANYEIPANEPQYVQECRTSRSYSQLFRTASWGEQEWRSYMWHYYRMTERVDHEIGRVLDALEQEGLEDNTLIIFTSDHGDGNASHRWAAKLSLYEEAASVPLIFTWLGRTRRFLDRENLASGLDILPTMCDFAGAPMPENARGRSLRPLIENPGQKPDREFIVTEIASRIHGETRKGRMVRTGQYKYCLYSYGKQPEQLFDMENDPGETQNLAASPSRNVRPILEKHRGLLKGWMQETADDFEPAFAL